MSFSLPTRSREVVDLAYGILQPGKPPATIEAMLEVGAGRQELESRSEVSVAVLWLLPEVSIGVHRKSRRAGVGFKYLNL